MDTDGHAESSCKTCPSPQVANKDHTACGKYQGSMNNQMLASNSMKICILHPHASSNVEVNVDGRHAFDMI
jgi:hypothetical protein